MKPIRTRLTAILAVTALTLVACSSGGGGGSASLSDAEKPYAEAIARSFETNSEDELQLSDKQADCVSGRMVKAIGVDKFEAAGISPEDLTADDSPLEETDLSSDEAGEVYDAFGKCDVDVRGELIRSMSEDDDMSDGAKKCLEEALTEDVVRGIIIASLTGQEDSPEAMAAFGAIMGCAFMDMGDFDFDDDDFDFDFDDEDFQFDFDEDFDFED